LDEPEAALSPARQLAFLQILKELAGQSQFIIVTHSPIIMAFPGAQILNFDSCPIEEIEYESTEHYLITKGFFNNKDLYLSKLFE
jgi:predicted ATPase